VRQLDAVVHDEELRENIVANARDYIETKHSEKHEYEAYCKMATDMCFAGDEDTDERQIRVRFQVEEAKRMARPMSAKDAEDLAADSAPSCTAYNETPEATEQEEETRSSENQLVMGEKQNQMADEDETSLKEAEDGEKTSQSTSEDSVSVRGNVIPHDGEDNKAESSQTVPGLPAAEDKDGEQQATITAGRQDNEENKIDDVEPPAGKLRTNPVTTDTAKAASTSSTRSPRTAASRTDVRKRTTSDAASADVSSSKVNPPASARKGGGAAGKNSQKQAPVQVSNATKKSTTTTTTTTATTTTNTTTPKKTSLNSSTNTNRVLRKSPSVLDNLTARTPSDSATVTKPKAGEVVARPAASRPQQRTSNKK